MEDKLRQKFENKCFNNPNIILIVVDALRADHLSCYGYGKLTSPNLDNFARESVLFQSAFSASPSTVGSIPSILSGLYPSFHGTGVDGNVLTLSSEIPILPEVLRGESYTTVGFNTNPYMASEHGYNRGYDSYFNLFTTKKEKKENDMFAKIRKKFTKFRFNKSCVCSKEVNKQVKIWLNNMKQPFFMWIHYLDVHGVYFPREPFFSLYSKNKPKDSIVSFKKQFNKIWAKIYKDPNSLTSEERELIVNCYDSEISYFDQNFKRLLNLLEEHRLLNNTIIIVTSDHGEEFWEHGRCGHYMRMYDINLHVPLLISYPFLDTKRKKVSKQVRNIDIFPTILDILNIKLNHRLSGVSLLPFIEDKNNIPENIVLSEGGGIYGIFVKTYVDRLYSIRTPQWKYIKNVTQNTKELYHLENDHFELKNLVDAPNAQDKIKEFDSCLNDLLKSKNEFKRKMSSVEISEETIERLKDLGYV